MQAPVFRRSWWGYNKRDVDLFLKSTADERQRLEEALARVEGLIADWQSGPEAILAAAHREAAEIRQKAERDTRNTARSAEARVQVIPLNPQQRDAAPPSDPSVPVAKPTPRFRSEELFNDSTRLPTPDIGLTASDLHAIDALERSRSNRRRDTKRKVGLVAACALVLVAIGFAFSGQGAKSHVSIAPQAVVTPAPVREQPGKRAVRSASVPTSPPQSPAPAPTPVSAPRSVGTKTLMLTISAARPCWIQTVVDGTQQMERLLQPADTVMLHATNEVLLKVGDAGAVSLLINNRPAKPLGDSGEVVTQLINRSNYASLLRPES